MYKTTTMNVQQAPQVGQTHGRAKHAIVIETVCITNDEVVPKGAALVVTGTLPEKLA